MTTLTTAQSPTAPVSRSSRQLAGHSRLPLPHPNPGNSLPRSGTHRRSPPPSLFGFLCRTPSLVSDPIPGPLAGPGSVLDVVWAWRLDPFAGFAPLGSVVLQEVPHIILTDRYVENLVALIPTAVPFRVLRIAPSFRAIASVAGLAALGSMTGPGLVPVDGHCGDNLAPTTSLVAAGWPAIGDLAARLARGGPLDRRATAS